jgi:hypothetical protein
MIMKSQIFLKMLAFESIGEKEAIKAIKNPQWKNTGNVHDWRNYIHDGTKELWNRLSGETRLVAYIMAYQQASREEHDPCPHAPKCFTTMPTPEQIDALNARLRNDLKDAPR